MTIEEFKEKYNGAPWDIETLANVVIDEVVDDKLYSAATDFVEAFENLTSILDEIGFERG